MKLLLLLLLPAFGFSQIKLEKITLPGGKVEIMSPTNLANMSDEMWAIKYAKKNRPTLVLTDEAGEVNLIADLKAQPITQGEIAKYKDFQIGLMKKERPDLRIMEDGIKTVHGKKIGYFKFLAQASDQKIFNYFFFTELGGKLLFFTFNCLEKQQKDWEKTADEIVASLNIK
ncbi:MAG: hypothetical protein V4722_28310 [Bacteroidota bacterium]